MRPDLLMIEARDEAYQYFDKNIRSLTKDSEGKVDPKALGLTDNDVDAFRHAYVSGVFTQVYNEEAADIFGRINEYSPLSWYSDSKNPGSLNMDLWNNSIGRKYGQKVKNRKELLKKIHEALRNGELIVEPKDNRKYEGKTSNSLNKSKPVIVLKEGEKGRNEVFFDLIKNIMLSREEFVASIESGDYPAYSVKIINGLPTPVSKPDGRETNNLS
ncbi:MAG: hypothetical protein HN353_04035 [Bdellovibrionales bacterium]|jgi:hypothetical protein|nr:hypothetical protein [Bdellovibrionales bacterium]MBT3525949.1 hypothetical protein [Bdellovibrionales bacterium]